MFTGLIAGTGSVTAATPAGAELDLEVDLAALRTPAIGDSIALSGVCCTVVHLQGKVARFRLSQETLSRTWLGKAHPGTRLNLEPALRVGDPLGGHFVQGHIDGTGRIVAPIDPRNGGELTIQLPRDLLRYTVTKGSIAIDGVSLTIARLAGPDITIAVIPHTAQLTTLGALKPDQPVNVEVDILGKYVLDRR